jgi:hypothetical protein
MTLEIQVDKCGGFIPVQVDKGGGFIPGRVYTG